MITRMMCQGLTNGEMEREEDVSSSRSHVFYAIEQNFGCRRSH